MHLKQPLKTITNSNILTINSAYYNSFCNRFFLYSYFFNWLLISVGIILLIKPLL